MKSLLLALSLIVSTQAMATPVEALNYLIADGIYSGTNGKEECSVKITSDANSSHVIIKNVKSYNSFVLLNKSQSVSINAEAGSISATENLRSPFYLNGGTLIFNVKANQRSVNFTISVIALDHKGNDSSTYNACSVLL